MYACAVHAKPYFLRCDSNFKVSNHMGFHYSLNNPTASANETFQPKKETKEGETEFNDSGHSASYKCCILVGRRQHLGEVLAQSAIGGQLATEI
ncbi:hypothetical protein RJT34_29637 [Clitoria ternatea]|uniref:Uncharacterized protein n=1 Tax=Clitoria ternatea TaxID=43366 RepID=A0AAN9ERB9_CLITE